MSDLAELTVDGPVNIAHVSALLGGAALRAAGRPAGRTAVKFDPAATTETAVRQAIANQDPAWVPPPSTAELDQRARAARRRELADKARAGTLTAAETREALLVLLERP